MTDDRHRFLLLVKEPPARLTAEQVAWILNCQPHDVPVLVGGRLLRPLGNPQPNSVKYFATVDVMELMKDRSWLGRMTNALSQHWRVRNQRKAAGTGEEQTSFALSLPPRPAAGPPARRPLPARTPPGAEA